jgi:hypothetical protein
MNESNIFKLIIYMRKTPIYTLIVLVGVGFFLGLLFADVTHDLQASSDAESV